MNRRAFLQSSLISSVAASLPAQSDRAPRIVLRSSWQTVNIGDIAHTPGVLALLEKHLPEAEIRLWPSSVGNGVDVMLQKRFPKLKIIKTEADRKAALAECDFMLHGSGPSLVAYKDVLRWSKETNKPFGIYGITFNAQGSTATQPASKEALAGPIQIMSDAKFVYFRDSVSLSVAKEHGCTCPIMEYSPDGAFAVDLTDDAKAEAFLKQHGLESGKFLCCIPRLRYTPYWTIPSKKMKPDPKKHERNEAMKEHDAKPLREAITRIVRETEMKVLLCPEDETQMAVAKEMLLDKLPDEIKSRVVWRSSYWLTDEALSTYRRSAGLFGHEMHSPILCIGSGVPAIVCRWAEQTTKGFMWRDIGLNDWLFDFDKEEDCQRMPEVALAMARDPTGSKARAAKAKQFVFDRFAETMGVVGKFAKAAQG